MNSKKSPILPLAMAVAGIGVGNLTAQPETITLPAPESIVAPAPEPEVKEVPIRFEELHHRADSSLRDALKLPEAKNSDIVALVANKDALIDKLRTLAGAVAEESEAVKEEMLALKAAVAQANAKISAAESYKKAVQDGLK